MSHAFAGPHNCISAGDASLASVSSDITDKLFLHHVSYEVALSGGGSPVGALTVQGGNTKASATTLARPTTIATVAVTGDGNYSFDLPFLCFRFVQLVYTRTSGSGAINASVFCQE